MMISMEDSLSEGEEACRSQLLGPDLNDEEEKEGRPVLITFPGFSSFLPWPFSRSNALAVGAAGAAAAADGDNFSFFAAESSSLGSSSSSSSRSSSTCTAAYNTPSAAASAGGAGAAFGCSGTCSSALLSSRRSESRGPPLPRALAYVAFPLLLGALGYCALSSGSASMASSGPLNQHQHQHQSQHQNRRQYGDRDQEPYVVDQHAFLSAQDPCWWIVWDNCKEANDAACGCRHDHPHGPCTPCQAGPDGTLASTCQKECCGGDKDGCAGNGLAIPTTTTTRGIDLDVGVTDEGDGSEASVEVQTLIGMGLGAGPPMPRNHESKLSEGGEVPVTDTNKSSGGGPSLWCFALSQPRGIELDVLRMQFERKIGIFACEGHKVYSNESVAIVGNYTPEVVVDHKDRPISLACDFGTEWHLALNAKIFAQVWAQIARRKPYYGHDALVKVDADTVFLPQRLRPILASLKKEDAWFLNNCVAPDQYLHGPMEVLSLGAAELFSKTTGDGSGISSCFDMYHRDPTDREDWFFGKCLEKLGAKRVDSLADQLVTETNCPPFPNPVSCSIPRVAYHPFKDPASWQACHSSAAAAATP